MVVDHKSGLRDRIATLAQTAPLSEPEPLADQLSMLIDGGLSQVRYLENEPTSQTFKHAATALIERRSAV